MNLTKMTILEKILLKCLDEYKENQEDLFEELRGWRSGQLGASDWTQVPDSPLDSTKKAEWATYRQALRDLPANVTDDNVNDIAYKAAHSSWPTKPSSQCV